MQGTPGQREAFQAAYEAWRAATDDYDAWMQSVMNGGEYDLATGLRKAALLATLHTDWMTKSKPFVRWK